MSYGLLSIAAGAIVGVGLVDGVEIAAQTNLAGPHLCDDRADGSVGSSVRGEGPFSGPDPKPKKVPAVLSGRPRLLPFSSHGLSDGRFDGGHESARGFWYEWPVYVCSRIWVVAGRFFGSVVGCPRLPPIRTAIALVRHVSAAGDHIDNTLRYLEKGEIIADGPTPLRYLTALRIGDWLDGRMGAY